MSEGCLTRAVKENVLIRSGDCSVLVLPKFGGKIASLRVKNHELLQAPLAPLGPRTRTMAFDASDASGWDECLPSVAACKVKTGSGMAEIPDHGDLWRVEWESEPGPARGEADSVTLRGTCFSLPLTLDRTIALKKASRGWQLELNYALTNTGRTSAPWSWAAHPLFAVDEGDQIELPSSIQSLRVEGSGRARLGSAGDAVAWPMATIAGNRKEDLRVAQDKQSGVADKLFAGPLRAEQNWCALHRPRAGVKVKFSFDPAATPYLGLWLCYGGWPDKSGPKQMCVAMEPSTAPVDSLAQTGDWSRILAPGESYRWPMRIDLEVL